MAKNSVRNVGVFTLGTKTIINNNLPDVGRCSTQFLADSGSTSTTLTNVTGMTSDTLEAGTYRVEINLITTSTANGGLKVALKQGTASMLSSLALTATAYSASGIANATITSTTDQASIIAATAAYVGARIVGTVVVSAAGTLTLQAAQNANHADDTTVEVGSTMIITRIGNS